MKAKEKIKALNYVTAWRTLKGSGLMTAEEGEAIGRRLNSVYGKYLSPIDR